MTNIQLAFNQLVAENDQSWSHLAQLIAEFERIIDKHRGSDDFDTQLFVAAARMVIGELKMRELRHLLIESNRIDG
jgi:hypothetical protein